MFYKELELIVSKNVQNLILLLVLDHALYMNLGRQGFELVNLEIRIIEGWVIEVLLCLKRFCVKNFSRSYKYQFEL